MLIPFPLQQWFRERVSMYIAIVVKTDYSYMFIEIIPAKNS
jgi:hypothetical protein